MGEITTQLMQKLVLEEGLDHHRAGRLGQAAEVYSSVLALNPGDPAALSLLGNVEYQRGDLEEALRLIGEAVRLDPDTPMHSMLLGHVHRQRGDLDAAAACYSSALALAPDLTVAATSLADALAARDDLPGANEVLRRQLSRGPATADLWFRLGVVAARRGLLDDATECFRAALVLEPSRADLPYNLGVIASDLGQLELAEAWFRGALSTDPGHVDARINLSAVLLKMGRVAQARVQRDTAYRQQCLFVREPAGAVRRVLILFDAGKGNVNLSYLFAPGRNALIDWMIEYAPPEQHRQLPPFDLVFNAIGDPDMAAAAAAASLPFIAVCDKPVLNRPDRVARTSREKIPALLAHIEGLVVPAVWRVAPEDPWPAEIARHLPVLVRPVDSHGGSGLQRITGVDELAQLAADRGEALYVTAFDDFVSADGFHRKYRVIFVDRVPFAYHLAIAPHWLVHYATADMPAHAGKLDEERRFLENPAAVLGAAGYAAVRAIGQALDLDYAGVDFSVLADGRILVFEANPTMLVHPEEPTGILAFKNVHVAKILDAFDAHLSRSCIASPSSFPVDTVEGNSVP